ncbi:hypothetical protein [Streptomyces sp. AP-93]|uniref:hypothetical protein n=1 Tax=Streptomyces sp. AP-93 TaxID=2929048 RepID=UPI0035B35EC5
MRWAAAFVVFAYHVRTFWRRRRARIYPLHLATAASALLLAHTLVPGLRPSGGTEAAANVLLAMLLPWANTHYALGWALYSSPSARLPELVLGVTLGLLVRTGAWRGPRPSDGEFAEFAGLLYTKTHLCRPRGPEAKGLMERANGHLETSFLPGRHFAGPDDFNTQLGQWLKAANRSRRRVLNTPTYRKDQHMTDQTPPVVHWAFHVDDTTPHDPRFSRITSGTQHFPAHMTARTVAQVVADEKRFTHPSHRGGITVAVWTMVNHNPDRYPDRNPTAPADAFTVAYGERGTDFTPSDLLLSPASPDPREVWALERMVSTAKEVHDLYGPPNDDFQEAVRQAGRDAVAAALHRLVAVLPGITEAQAAFLADSAWVLGLEVVEDLTAANGHPAAPATTSGVRRRTGDEAVRDKARAGPARGGLRR